MRGNDLLSALEDAKHNALVGANGTKPEVNERKEKRREKKLGARSKWRKCDASDCSHNDGGRCLVTEDVKRYLEAVPKGMSAVCLYYDDGVSELPELDEHGMWEA